MHIMCLYTFYAYNMQTYIANVVFINIAIEQIRKESTPVFLAGDGFIRIRDNT